MQDIVELERRIAGALERLGRGIEGLVLPAAPAEAAPVADTAAEIALAEITPAAAPEILPVSAPAPLAVAEEESSRDTLARLRERLAAARDREAVLQLQHEEKLTRLTRQLDVQGLELQRMRKMAATLREELRELREAQMSGQVDPAHLNRALLAELDALRASRLSEMAELEEIAVALDEHLTEAEHA